MPDSATAPPSPDHEKRLVTDDDVEIAYRVWSRPSRLPPVVLHHGFAGDGTRDWVETGVVEALTTAGHTVVVLDARGHGSSGKPHRSDAYGEERMARDLGELIDALGVDALDLVGFSMGGVVAAIAATREDRIRRMVTAGVGASLVEKGGVDTSVMLLGPLVKMLLSDDPASTGDPSTDWFLDAVQGRNVDRLALAMHARSFHDSPIPLERITAATLVLAGDSDPLARRPHVLADAIPEAHWLVIEGDHASCITNPAFAANVLEFLGEDAASG